jgi:carboxymethylenebutenolidase
MTDGEDRPMAGEMIQIAAKEGKSFAAYLSKPPQGGPGNGHGKVPGIVMCQEMLGVTPWLKSMADRIAAEGYLVIAPDIFWRFHPGFVGNHGDKDDYDKAWSYLRNLDYDLAVQDVADCADALKAMPGCNGKIGVVGFCMGGTIAYLAAARLPVDAAVSYYGTGVHHYVNEGGKIACPLTLHMGDKDHTLKPEDVHEIYAALIGIPHISVWRYDTGHAFANSDVPSLYSKEHAEKAHERTLSLFGRLK